MKAVYVKVSLELIARLLQVPDGVELRGINVLGCPPGEVEMMLVGEGLPDKFAVAGDLRAQIMRASPRLYRVEPKIEWVWE